MEEQKHNIVSSESMYKYKCLEIILHICESLIGNKMFFCFTRQNLESDDEVKSNKPSFEFNFFWLLEVALKLLEELPGAIEFVKTLPKECATDKIDGLFSNVTQRLIKSYGNKEYYLGLKQSTVYKSYYICLIRRNLSDQRELDTSFCLTIPASSALLNRLPATLHKADSHHELCWTKQPKTIPLKRTITDVVFYVSQYNICINTGL